jgi:hypothetical protein
MIEICQVKYLNNIIEQDHRFIKKITKPMMGFKAFHSAQATIVGIENFSNNIAPTYLVIGNDYGTMTMEVASKLGEIQGIRNIAGLLHIDRITGEFIRYTIIALTGSPLSSGVPSVIHQVRYLSSTSPASLRVADSPLFGMKIAPQKSAILSNPIETE